MDSFRSLCMLFLLIFSLTLSEFSAASPLLLQQQHKNSSLECDADLQEIPSLNSTKGRLLASAPPVQLTDQGNYVTLNNGIIEVTFKKPEGCVTVIKYNEIDNVLEVLNEEDNRGYWDVDWSVGGKRGTKGILDKLEGTDYKVIVQNEDRVELSFVRTWKPEDGEKVIPLIVDKRFVMLRGSSGFYTYAIYEHLKEWPHFIIDNTRFAFKLSKHSFQYMVVSDNRQRHMPLPDDRLKPRGQKLAYPEAVLLVDPVDSEFKGQVDDKYQYAKENRDTQVHGWISTKPAVGFWLITPSYEYRSGGPFKQVLTSHVGPSSLTVFSSAHYAGEDMVIKFAANETWKKVYGPFFVHLNSLTQGDNPLSLWDDAKKQATIEAEKWPYDFVASKDFPPSNQRGKVTGRLFVQDKYVDNEKVATKGAYVGLASPGAAGSWQTECKGYQFWTISGSQEAGNFVIDNVRPGEYNLYAYVPNYIGDYKYETIIKVEAGQEVNVGDLVYEPPRRGKTLWEIGIPDRSAAEFFVPDPNPKYVNKLYVNQERFRQYGLWERYAELYPNSDMAFTVGSSNYSTDWFFAQVTRKKDNNTYEGTTWQINFNLDEVNNKGAYALRLATATMHGAMLEVRVNDRQANPPIFSVGTIGKDNAIARHGIHGLYRLFNVDVPADKLHQGNNTIFLTLACNFSPFQGIMYDYVRLEAPPSSDAPSSNVPSSNVPSRDVPSSNAPSPDVPPPDVPSSNVPSPGGGSKSQATRFNSHDSLALSVLLGIILTLIWQF